ncbi:hypothetical protein JNO54_00325 [Janibacter sp. YIM B02568]|uniref:hypothetical protein n=1 Tax=Janibacter endophyticus TaxID=2806261 RepID=UPI00194EC325|nr:hypothetical protein [Janibacter endophyticus]MBM6544593.1 hypothetical protein [Janibacter endophyticus]
MKWILIALAVIAVLVVIALVVSSSRKRQVEANRQEATELRERAADRELDLREQQAASAETAAQAEAARADADLKAAEAERQRVEAERLQAEARDADDRRSVLEDSHREDLRRADEIDPDVRTDKDGNRIDDSRDGRGGAAAGGAGYAATDRDGDGYRDNVIESEDSYADDSHVEERRDGDRADGDHYEGRHEGGRVDEQGRSGVGDRDGDGDYELDERARDTFDDLRGEDGVDRDGRRG